MPCDADAATRGIASPVSAEPDDAGLSGSGETMAQVGCGSIGECSDDSRTLLSTRCHRLRNQAIPLVVIVTSRPLLQTWATTSEISPVLCQELREDDCSGVVPFTLSLSGNRPVHLSRIHDPYGELLAGPADHLHECEREDRRVGTRVAGRSTCMCAITRT